MAKQFLFLMGYFSVVGLYGMDENTLARAGSAMIISQEGVAVNLAELPGGELPDIEEEIFLQELNPLLPEPSRHISQERRNKHILQVLNTLHINEPNRHQRVREMVQTRRAHRSRAVEFGVSPSDIREFTDFLAKEVLNKENGLLSEKLTSEKAQKICSGVMTAVVIVALLTAEVLFVTLG